MTVIWFTLDARQDDRIMHNSMRAEPALLPEPRPGRERTAATNGVVRQEPLSAAPEAPSDMPRLDIATNDVLSRVRANVVCYGVLDC